MWTDENVATLTKLWVEGLTGSQIAKQIGGTTRQACIAKAWRMGLKPRPRSGEHHGIESRMNRRKRDYAPRRMREVKKMEKPEPIAPLNTPFLDTRPNQCRAITDSTRYAQRCCGHPVAGEGDVYCPAHKALHYTGRGKSR